MTGQITGKTAPAPPPASAVVIVVDDDPTVRGALDSLFRSIGMATGLFGSPAELLQSRLPDVPGCIILDVRLPGVSGLEFQAQLASHGIEFPIVFITGHGDIPMSVRAMKAGAVDFLSKPFREQDMFDAVTAAIERDRQRRSEAGALRDLSARYEMLTQREREVMAHVIAGLMNKQVAVALGLSEITVKIHRSNMMRKMRVRSVAELVRQAQSLGISPA